MTGKLFIISFGFCDVILFPSLTAYVCDALFDIWS